VLALAFGLPGGLVPHLPLSNNSPHHNSSTTVLVIFLVLPAMPTSDQPRRMLKALLSIVAMLLVTWLVAPRLTTWQRDRLAEQLVEQVAQAADSQVKVPLRQLAELGLSAIEPLAEAATSERAAVSTIARQILDEKWAAWKALAQAHSPTSSDFVTPTTTLVTVLSARIDKFGPGGQLWAERLALEMIEVADVYSAPAASRLLANCIEILTAVPPRGPRLRTATVPATTSVPRIEATPEPPLESLTRFSEKAFESSRPGSVLAFRRSGLAENFTSAETAKPLPPPVDWSPDWKTKQIPETTSPARRESLPPPRAAVISEVPASRVVDIPTPQAMQNQAETLRRLTTEELLQQLGGAAFYEAGVLRAVLRERGYDDAELAFLGRLVSPEVTVRLQLIEDVAVLPAAAAQRWLRLLLKDPAGDVRLRALTALATTSTPSLPVLARELAATDEDPRVLQLATRLMRRVR